VQAMMKHYLVRFDQPPLKTQPTPALVAFLRSRKWITVVENFHNQSYYLIETEEALPKLRASIVGILAPNMEPFLRLVSEADLPPPGADLFRWVEVYIRTGTWS
jgi:hypothetical protein